MGLAAQGFALVQSVVKVQKVLLPAWYTQPNLEGTADPLASVFAKSRLVSVVQEFPY